jgi:hypothetical protein
MTAEKTPTNVPWKFVLALAAMTVSSSLWAQNAGSLGAGIIVGEPLGLTGKYWIDETRAVDLGIGFGGEGTVAYADFLWHAWNILPQPSQGKLGLYVGAGPRLETEEHHDEGADARLGIRTIGGVDYWVQGHPIEVFLEAGPVFLLTPRTDVEVDAGLGVRFYFAGAK